MFGIVIDSNMYKVAFVVLENGIPQDYKLQSGESVVTTDWQKANAMGKPHWTGTVWEDLNPPEQIDICPEQTADERITQLEADKVTLAENVYMLAEIIESLVGGTEDGQSSTTAETTTD